MSIAVFHLIATLADGHTNFSSFDFDAVNQLIYAGCNSKNIQAYAMTDYHLVKTINSLGVPLKVFYNNGSIISVSGTYSYIQYTGYLTTGYCFIEQF